MASQSRPRRPLRWLAMLLALPLASGCSTFKQLEPITPSAYAAAGATSEMRLQLTQGGSMTVYSPRMEGDTLRGLCATSLEAKSM